MSPAVPQTARSSATPARLGILDLVKAIASNLIVLHHLAFYGPMSDYLAPVAADLMAWLRNDARIAVQAFLVIGGFLCARSLAPDGVPRLRQPFQLLLRRYLKLALPFVAAMAVAVLCSAVARGWMTHESISGPARVDQFAAHALLLHDVLGFEALSAGAWYVAIDFQLYGLMLGLLWLGGMAGGKRAWPAPMLVCAAAALSLWHVNLDSDWDIWAPYFFGSYALGALAWWACSRGNAAAVLLNALLVLLAGVAMLIEFRSRVAFAAAMALMLALACRTRLPRALEHSAAAGFLGRISYSVFLVHFPVCLLVNAAFTRYAPALLEAQAAGVLLAWLASLGAGYAFHRWVETPLSAGADLLLDMRRRLRPASAAVK